LAGVLSPWLVRSGKLNICKIGVYSIVATFSTPL
jgi:hypothetical protein